MIVLPLIMFPVLGLVMGYAVQSAQSEALKSNFGNRQQRLTTAAGITPSSTTWTAVHERRSINKFTPRQVVDQGLLTQYNSTTFIVEIPQGFNENLTRHAAGEYNITGTLNVYGVFNVGGGIFSGIGSSGITHSSAASTAPRTRLSLNLAVKHYKRPDRRRCRRQRLGQL